MPVKNIKKTLHVALMTIGSVVTFGGLYDSCRHHTYADRNPEVAVLADQAVKKYCGDSPEDEWTITAEEQEAYDKLCDESQRGNKGLLVGVFGLALAGTGIRGLRKKGQSAAQPIAPGG